jgi:hypothetical protein
MAMTKATFTNNIQLNISFLYRIHKNYVSVVEMPSKTRKLKGSKVLKVDAKHKIPKFEQQIKAGTINFVLVYAEWCGACHRFMDNIWNPMCKGKARHNRMAVRDDMIKSTSLANANFDYLPSVLIVDEAGQLQSFKTPEGKDTNAMPTPKSLNDMKKIVNVPVLNITNSLNGKPVANRKNTPFVRNSSPTRVMAEPESPAMPNIPAPSPSPNRNANRLTTEEPEPMGTPAGVVYRPTPMAAPQKGGRRIAKRARAKRATMRFPKEFMRRFGLAFTRRLKN